MAYRDFQHFLEDLEAKGELRRISEPVSPYLEITEIADRVVKSGGPALLFERPVGPPPRIGTPDPASAVMGHDSIHPAAAPQGSVEYRQPVAINTMGTRRRMSLALSCEDFEEHAARIRDLVSTEPPKSKRAALNLIAHLISEVKTAPPKTVTKAISQENVQKGDEIDLSRLPILTCWPEDGGAFVTLPMVFTHDPATGKRNVGMYRLQVMGKDLLGMHWQMHKTGQEHLKEAAKRGQPVQVCVALGGDPALAFSALAPLPPGIDEMLFAGFLRRQNVAMVKSLTNDMLVPADAEIVIEGLVDPAERALEGPFGDHTGYYSLAEPFPVFRVKAVTMREHSVYPATVVGIPPMEDAWMGKAVERIFLPLLQLTLPELVDIDLPVESCFHNIAFVSFKKKYPGHAYKVMNALWGMGQLAFSKFVFAFDEDCDVHNLAEVLFRIGANCDPSRDTLHSKGPVDHLDHAAQSIGFGGKIGFDCTHKWPGENGFARDFPKRIVMAPDVKTRIDELWPKLGL